MSAYLIIAVAGAVVFGLIVLGWRMWYRAGKTQGTADQRLRNAEGARSVEQEMADTMLEHPSKDAIIKDLENDSF